MTELILEFPAFDLVTVRLDKQQAGPMRFVSPLTDKDQEEIRWYLEIYGAKYTSEVDDARASGIQKNFAVWGEALLGAVLGRPETSLFLDRFDQETEDRTVTIATTVPEILALPWELLRHPQRGYWLLQHPRISLRRRLRSGVTAEVATVQPKNKLQVLYVIARPVDAEFIDPRAEAQPVLNAIAEQAADRVEVEFLRPGTFRALVERLQDGQLPTVDILHFDGHGAFNQIEGMGSLVFSRPGSETRHLVSAKLLGDTLRKAAVPIVILSACQSARVGEEALGSVAARLTDAGIPVVLAMTHSVLVAAATKLFGEFYQQLAEGQQVGVALGLARETLHAQMGRGSRTRLNEIVELQLEDWFIPALYGAAEVDPVLLQPLSRHVTHTEVATKRAGNLPQLQNLGFIGRARELWAIEQAFIAGVRRATISGFGGQGKSYLAAETADWLCRTGMFETVCWVTFQSFQGVDALGLAVSTLATVLETSLVDAVSAQEALQNQAVLIVLDNLDDVQTEPLQELLVAAKHWSEVGQSRILLTTRQDTLRVQGYETKESPEHLQLNLQGLAPSDALALFERVWELPPVATVKLPDQNSLRRLFAMVSCHPLSIRLLGRELKRQSTGDIGVALARLLQETQETNKDRNLLASLRLSLERLEAEVRLWLPKLGVFEGGVWEPLVAEVTGLKTEQWERLRDALQDVGLVHPEVIPGIEAPFLRFHPTLRPVLWQEMSRKEQEAQILQAKYRQAYAQLVTDLYQQERTTPIQARQLVQQELPNFLKATYEALTIGDEFAIEFAGLTGIFLGFFGLNKEFNLLEQHIRSVRREVRSRSWYNQRHIMGEQLLNTGRVAEALPVFKEMLTELGVEYVDIRCITLISIGRCLKLQGQLPQAVESFREAMTVAAQLEQQQHAQRVVSATQVELANVLRDMGQASNARTAYETALSIAQELKDERQIAVVEGQLGSLELYLGNITEAQRRFTVAIQKTRELQEPVGESIFWNQLGIAHQEAGQLEAAEEAYRESARIKEALGNLTSAAKTWNQLALVCHLSGKLETAEAWYRKALVVNRRDNNPLALGENISNLASLLQDQGGRLDEAMQLAKEALAVFQTVNPEAAKIWKIYTLLATIAERQNNLNQAKVYRQQAREARVAYTGAQYELLQWQQMISLVVNATRNTAARQQLEEGLRVLADNGRINLVEAVRMVLAGTRSIDLLCKDLNLEEEAIVLAILQQLTQLEQR